MSVLNPCPSCESTDVESTYPDRGYLCPECGEPLIDHGGELLCESCDEVFDEFDVEEAGEVGECDPEYDYDDGECV